MEELRKHDKLWKRIAPNDSFDTRACKTLVNAMEGGESISTGKLCIEFLTQNLDKALAALHPPMPPLQDNQCDSSLEAEAIERMLTCVHACFKTDRGVISLENDFLLFQDVLQEDRESWLNETCERWKGLLHSSLQEEFCIALRLWFLAQEAKT
jgi:hypothetical protein